MDAQTTPRTVAFNLLVVGSNSAVYSLAYVHTVMIPNAWNLFEMDASLFGWRIYGPGAPGSSGANFTTAELLAHATWGPLLLGGSVVGVGFNLGSSQRNAIAGIDWLETSLLNSGDRIDFGNNFDCPIGAGGGNCAPCAAGSVSQGGRNATCQACTGRGYTTAAGASACLTCPDGKDVIVENGLNVNCREF
jgi:hypothetical protein